MKGQLTLPRLKKRLVSKAREDLEARIAWLTQCTDEIIASRNAETKSSAGDKHETSRALAQAELDRASSQLAKARSLKANFEQIDFDLCHPEALSGSLIKTEEGLFLLGVGLGKVETDRFLCHAISPGSPLGQSLLRKKQGDTFSFQSRHVTILELA